MDETNSICLARTRKITYLWIFFVYLAALRSINFGNIFQRLINWWSWRVVPKIKEKLLNSSDFGKFFGSMMNENKIQPLKLLIKCILKFSFLRNLEYLKKSCLDLIKSGKTFLNINFLSWIVVNRPDIWHKSISINFFTN